MTEASRERRNKMDAILQIFTEALLIVLAVAVGGLGTIVYLAKRQRENRRRALKTGIALLRGISKK